MKIVLATQNKDKVEEIRAYLQDAGVILSEAKDPRESKEESETLRENALQKAHAVAKKTGEWALADDTGLFVTALEGRPGAFSARFAGEKATYAQNVDKLLEEMKQVPTAERSAYFSCVMALVSPDGKEVTVEGRLEGEIVSEPKGNFGFGYDPVFFLPDLGKTLAEIPLEEKNRISHRGRALGKIRVVLEGLKKIENGK